MTRSSDIICAVDSHNLVGESPVWDPVRKSVYWVDINGFTVQRYSPECGETMTWHFGEVVSALSLTSNPDWILVALGSRLILWAPDTGERVELCRPEPDWPANRLNDGASDPNGYFWIGSMKNNVGTDGSHLEVSGEQGSLYRISPERKVTVWDTGFGITNTIVWSPDRQTFYCGCSLRNLIYAYDFDSNTSSIGNRRVFMANSARGMPDGSAMDAEGYLWNCRYSGGCIVRISPSGKVDRIVEMPVSNITNCCFAGEDLQMLYVTTASLQAPSGERLAGSLFSVRVETRGIPAGKFRIPLDESEWQRETRKDPL